MCERVGDRLIANVCMVALPGSSFRPLTQPRAAMLEKAGPEYSVGTELQTMLGPPPQLPRVAVWILMARA